MFTPQPNPPYPTVETTRQARRRYQSRGVPPAFSDAYVERTEVLARREQQAREREAPRGRPPGGGAAGGGPGWWG